MDGKVTFVAVSGGRTSGYMAYLLKDKPNHTFFFQNTGRERPETLDFLDKMDKEFDLNLIWMEYYCPDPKEKAGYKIVNYKTANRTGRPFSELNQKRQAIPNQHKRFCTMELKIFTARRYIRSLKLKPLRWNYALGYRSDEPLRKTRSDSMQNTITPLRDMGLNIEHVSEFWKAQSFDLKLPMLPNGKTFGGNCMGCFWHSEYQNKHLCATRPKDVKWLIEEEEKHGHTFNKNFSFKELKDMPDGLLGKEEYLCMETNGSCGDL